MANSPAASPGIQPPPAVTGFGPALTGLQWAPVAVGGFSGAAVWRGVDTDGLPRVALKAYPRGMKADRLREVHDRQRRAADRLAFVPRLLPSADGSTAVTTAGRLWDAATWVPGTADFHAHPSAARLANACAALAALHHVWRPAVPHTGPALAVRSRLALLADFRNRADDRPPPSHHRLADSLARGRRELTRLVPAVETALRPWATVPVTVQPCVRDVWHDHVLFTGDAVTGLIDFAATRADTVATDLARLLGSLVPGDDAAFAAGLSAYRSAGGSTDVPDEFVRLLARTGVVCAVAGWLLRLGGMSQPPANVDAVADRVAGLVGQLEGFAA